MAKFQHQRDNILDASERAASARKCLDLLGDVKNSQMSVMDWDFVNGQIAAAEDNLYYSPTEPQLQWLRDCVERYVT